MCRSQNRMRGSVASVDDGDDVGGAAGQSSFPCPHSALQWTPGEEAPPFSIDNPAAVNLCVQIISGAVGDLPAIIVTEAVAVQIYRLVRDRRAPPELKVSERNAVYVILASLARRALVETDALAAIRLDNVLARKGKQAPGLHHALAALVGRRARDTEMSLMSYDDATMLYFIAWEGYSADASTWEPASNVGAGAIKEYHDSLREEAEADGAAEAELESSDDESDDDAAV